MFSKNASHQFPLWHYLTQPLFHHHYQAVLNPQRFWYLYSIALLERCLERDCASKDHHRD